MPEDRNYEEEAKRKLDKWLKEHPVDSIRFDYIPKWLKKESSQNKEEK